MDERLGLAGDFAPGVAAPFGRHSDMSTHFDLLRKSRLVRNGTAVDVSSMADRETSSVSRLVESRDAAITGQLVESSQLVAD